MNASLKRYDENVINAHNARHLRHPIAESPPTKDVPIKGLEATYAHGVMVRASGPNLIPSLPLIVNADDIRLILDALDAGLGAVEAGDTSASAAPERSLGVSGR